MSVQKFQAGRPQPTTPAAPTALGLTSPQIQLASLLAQLGVPFLEEFLAPSFQEQLGQQIQAQTAAQRAQLPFLRAQARIPQFGQEERLPGLLRQQELQNLASALGLGQRFQQQRQRGQFQTGILESLGRIA